MQTFEIEIKSLLGVKERADALLEKLKQADRGVHLIHKGRQLNHYFIGGDFNKLQMNLKSLLTPQEQTQLKEVLEGGKNHSVRTREVDSKKVIFVVKASADETTSFNGTARLEFEIVFDKLPLQKLDQILLDSDLQYQAKWSRQREEYAYKDMVVCLDKNAGYGYLAEFERVVPEGVDLEKVKSDIREEMKSLGVEELSQDRLARMFEHYNKNWASYYGTEKTFVIE